MAASPNILAAFDEEYARMHLQDHPPTIQSSNTMRMALNHPAKDRDNLVRPTLSMKVPSAPAPTHKERDDKPTFPLYSYKASSPTPSRLYIRDQAEADEQASKLEGPLGFDLEWRVFFGRRMSERKTAVLQICDDRTILVLQLTAMKGFPQKVKAIVEAHGIIKMGVNILNDGHKLRRDYGINPAGLLELSHLARLVDPVRVTNKRMIGLQRIVEMYTNTTLSKGSVRTSNWEAMLNEEQLEYAANDAHSALRVYNELVQLARDKALVLKAVVTPGSTTQPAMGVSYVIDSPDVSSGSKATKVDPSRAQQSSGSEAQAQGLSPAVPFLAVNVRSPEQYLADAKTKPVRGQLLRAYKLWHEELLSLPDLCSTLRSPEHPLAKSTVITYVVEALKADNSLPFSRQRLRELAKLDHGSWQRHGWWIDMK